MPKNWCLQTMVLKKTHGSPMDCKEIKPVNTKRNQSWIFIGRADDESEAPILWPPDVKNWLIRKDHDAGKDWRQEKKRTTKDKMAGWHHWLNGHEFEQTAWEEQVSLVCCSIGRLKGVANSRTWLSSRLNNSNPAGYVSVVKVSCIPTSCLDKPSLYLPFPKAFCSFLDRIS